MLWFLGEHAANYEVAKFFNIYGKLAKPATVCFNTLLMLKSDIIAIYGYIHFKYTFPVSPAYNLMTNYTSRFRWLTNIPTLLLCATKFVYGVVYLFHRIIAQDTLK